MITPDLNEHGSNGTFATTKKNMEQRKTILSSGCYLENFFRRKKFLEINFKELLKIQYAVAQNDFEFVKGNDIKNEHILNPNPTVII